MKILEINRSLIKVASKIVKGSSLFLLMTLITSCVTTESKGPLGNRIVWTSIGESADNQAQYAIDLKNLERNGRYVRYMSRTLYEGHTDKARIVGIPPHKSSISVWQINCADKTYNIVSSNFYNAQGVLVYSQNFDLTNTQPEPIRRGSASEIQFFKVCDAAKNLPSRPFTLIQNQNVQEPSNKQ